MIRQQRANHFALAAVVRRSEAELLCLQRSLLPAASLGLAAGESDAAATSSISQSVAASERVLRQCLAACEARCCALEGRLDGIEQRLPSRVRRTCYERSGRTTHKSVDIRGTPHLRT